MPTLMEEDEIEDVMPRLNDDATVIEILEALEATPGSLAKRAILDKNVRNDLLKRAFVAAGDPYTVYYVNKFSIPKEPVSLVPIPDDDLLDRFIGGITNMLSTRKITGNDAKAYVTGMFKTMTSLQQKWCQRILLKNMRCGVQTTVNKVWPGAIKTFDVALAETLKSEFVKGNGIKILEKVTYPVRVEPKLDGLRCIAVKQNGVVIFYTRNGMVLETLPKIKWILEDSRYDNAVLDGEAMGEDWNESASVLMAKKSKHDDSNIVYNVFDALPLENWVSQETKTPYSERIKMVAHIVSLCNDRVKQVPHIMAQNESELKTYFAECMDGGFEGVMLKTLNTPYKFKRSDNILKLKPCVTYEGVIVAHYEGRRGSKREGLWGGFEVVLPNGVVTRLGGGFSDVLKAQIQTEGPDTWIGRIVEIEAQPDPLTSDGLTYDGKARFPVYTRIRDESDVDPKVIAAGKAYLKHIVL